MSSHCLCKRRGAPTATKWYVIEPLRVNRNSTEFVISLTKEAEEIELPDKIQEAQLNWVLVNHE